VIRNFLYLDSEKLRSLSSQLFEGVADSVLQKTAETAEESGSQKGPVGSGRVLADIFSYQKSYTELRFLEDHAYTLFEEEILARKMVVNADSNAASLDFSECSFVRIVGELNINDTAVAANLIKNFNSLGASLYRVTNQASLEAKALGKPILDKEIEKLAKAQGLQMDAKFLEHLASLTEFGSKGVLEFQIAQAGKLFSAPAKRDSLREPEILTIQKYSRHSEANFTMLGIVTQYGKEKNASDAPVDVKDAGNFKGAMRTLSEHMRVLEDSLSGVLENEVVVDPIAVYQIL
jgi:hypothetical protein